MEINEELDKIKQEIATKTSQGMSEGQAKALLDTVSKPEGALGLHLAKSITSKVQEGAGKERLEKTADKIIDSGLKTFETNADNELNKTQVTAEEVYFKAKQVQLNRGGIKKATSQKVMSRVVFTDDIWSDINFYLFTWWVIGVNNYFSNMREFHWFFKSVINLLFTIPAICLIPIEFCIGVVACITHFVILGIKNIIRLFKTLFKKWGKKDVEMVREDYRQVQREPEVVEFNNDYIDTCNE